MGRSLLRRSALLLLLVLLGGCASKRPVLYRDYGQDPELARIDVAECVEIAEEEAGRERAGAKVAKDTATGGGAGAAIGAAGGAVRGRAGVGAATGAATGATAGFLRGLFRSREPDPIFRSYVQMCLADRGYRVVGWR